MVDDAIDLGGAVAAVGAELADGVSFDDPLLKPGSLFPSLVVGVGPAKRFIAAATEPTLAPVCIVAVSSCADRKAIRTVFF